MARWATLVEIAGHSYTGCRALLVDGEGFLSPYAGSVDWGNDAMPDVQTVNRGIKGIPFGVQFLSSEQSLLLATVSSVQSSQAASSNFRVKLTVGLYTIDVMAVPDYSQGKSWITHGPFSEGWYENVLMRFISEAVGA